MTFHFLTAVQLRIRSLSPGQCGMAQLVGASSPRPKGRRFDSQSGHIARLWVPSLVRAHMGKQPINVSLFPSLPLSFSPSTSPSLPLSLKAMGKKRIRSLSYLLRPNISCFRGIHFIFQNCSLCGGKKHVQLLN